jgi:hypothetical protein
LALLSGGSIPRRLGTSESALCLNNQTIVSVSSAPASVSPPTSPEAGAPSPPLLLCSRADALCRGSLSPELSNGVGRKWDSEGAAEPEVSRAEPTPGTSCSSGKAELAEAGPAVAEGAVAETAQRELRPPSLGRFVLVGWRADGLVSRQMASFGIWATGPEAMAGRHAVLTAVATAGGRLVHPRGVPRGSLAKAGSMHSSLRFRPGPGTIRRD